MPKAPSGSRETRPVTLSEVAKLAGVSLPTASRVLNGGVRGTGSGTEESRVRVLAAAERLGYVVNAAAQTTAAGASRSLALIVSDLDDFGATTMISGVMHAAEARGLSVAVRATNDDADHELRLLRDLRGERHRGVVMATSRSNDFAREARISDALGVLEDLGTRVVVIGQSELPYSSVVVDNRTAAGDLARRLCKGMRGRVAIVAGPADQVTSRDRVAGFIRGAAEAGVEIEAEDIVHESFNRDGGIAAADRLAPRIERFALVAAMSDAMAVGIIAGLRRHGVIAPGRLEVSGFDNVPIIGDVLPGFSTVAVPLERFGEAAVSLLFETGDAPRRIELNARPIVRGELADSGDAESLPTH